MNKKTLSMVGLLVLAFLAGMAVMRVWDAHHTPALSSESQMPSNASLLLVDMEAGTEPEGVVDVEEPKYVDDSAIPSQLSKIKVQGLDRVISRSGADIDAPQEENDSPVVLGDVDRTAVPSATAPVPLDTSNAKSNRTMINAPVQARVIKSVEDYKAFKRKARGKYPAADFAKDYVVVLESASNLPDNVFEIQDVQEEGGKMVVFYRVNIFGLDQKTNTHSAARIDKRDLPIELKQVL